jgi:arylsulfatase
VVIVALTSRVLIAGPYAPRFTEEKSCRKRSREPIGPARLHIDDKTVAEAEIRTIYTRYGLSGEGLCIGYDGGDAVSSQYADRFAFANGTIHKVIFDVAEDQYADVEQHFAAAMARD